MRNTFFLLALAASYCGFAQFGANAGYVNVNVKTESDPESASGFSAGLTYEVPLSGALSIRPELQFMSISSEGESTSFMMLPAAFMYNIDETFFLQFGPSFKYHLEDSDEAYKNFTVDGLVGAAYSFTDNIYLQARYYLQLTNSLDADYTWKYNTLSLSVGYNF